MAANLGTASGRIEIDGSGAQKGFQVASAAADQFFAAVQAKVGSLEQIGQKMQAVGAVGAAGFGVALGAAANFEAGLSGIQAISGATAQEMDLISAAALRIGKDTSFSASEAASAIEEIIKAGVSVEDTLNGAADATVSLAAAGGISLPEAATIASNALNAFNLKGTDMAHVSDLIAGAANASAIDVSQFGQSLSQAGAVANLAGVPFDDLSVAIAEMGQAGIKGSDAGTSIKTFLTNLIPTTEKQRDTFEELGLVSVNTGADFAKMAAMGIKPASMRLDDVNDALAKYVEASGGGEVGTAKNNEAVMKLGNNLGVLKNEFFDASGKAKPFGQIQEELAQATAGMTKEQKLQTLEVLFGSDALRAAAVFAGEGAAGFDAMAESMSKVTAAQVAATRLDNFKGSVEALKGSLETAAITIGSVFLPAARFIVDAIAAVVNVFNGAPPAVQKFLAIIAGVALAMTALVGTILTLIVPISLFIAKFAGMAVLKGIFSIFTVGFAQLRAGAGVMTAVSAAVARAGVVFNTLGGIATRLVGFLLRIPAALTVIRTIAAAAFGPWGIAIALVVTALVLLYQKFAPFRALVDGIAASIKAGFVAALTAARAAIAQVVSGFQSGVTGGSAFATFMQTIGAGARILWNALVQLAGVFMTQLLPALKAAGAVLVGALMTAWQTISTAVTGSLLPALRQLGAALAPLLPALTQIAGFLLKLVGAVLLAGVAVAGALLLGLIKLGTVIIGTVLPAIIQFVAFLIGGFVSAITAVISAVISVVAAIVSFVAGIVAGFTQAQAATTSGATAIGAALQSIVGFFTTVFTAVQTFIVTVFTAIWTFIVTTVTAIATGIQTGFSAVVAFFTSVFTSMQTIATTVWTAIQTAVSAGIAFVQNIITTGVAAIKAVWDAFWSSGFGQLVVAAWELIKSIVQLGIAVIQLAIAVGLAAIRVAWDAAWNALSAAASAVWAVITSVVSTAINGLLSVVTTVMSAIQTAVTVAWNAVSSAISAAIAVVVSVVTTGWNAVSSVVSSVMASISSVISSAWSAIQSAVSSAVNAIQSVVTSVWNAISSATSAVWNAIYSAIEGPLNRAKAVVDTVTGAIKSALQAAWDAAKQATQAAWDSIVKAIQDAIAKVKSVLSTVKGVVTGAFSGAATWLLSAGRDIVNGLISGITDKLGAAKAKIDELTSLAKTAAKKALSIGSPSKVFADYGKWTVEGYQEGVDARLNSLARTMRSMTGVVTDTPLVVGMQKPTSVRENARRGVLERPTVHQEITIINPERERDSKAIDDSLQLTGAFL